MATKITKSTKTQKLNATHAKKELLAFASPHRANVNRSFFKTGQGQYGEGDVFIGVSVPDTRSVATRFQNLNFVEIKKLMTSPLHEERLLAIIILSLNFKKWQKMTEKEKIYKFCIKHRKHINNWDLVDTAAPTIVGAYLLDKSPQLLYQYGQSKNMWERRIAIVSTLTFIRNNHFTPTLELAVMLLNDSHDLIHKAVGWMLRELGKKDQAKLKDFLHTHYKQMPRTMLRYAIEKFPESQRKGFLQGHF